MKRMHIHVGVNNISDSVKFYSALFGAEPDKTKPDYAKWMLSDPRINFAISTSASKGVDHLGLQVEEEHELEELRERLKAADMSTFDEGETVCCYARSDKTWVTDPEGVPWETYKTMDDVNLFHEQSADAPGEIEEGACCTPETKDQPGCCVPSEKTAGCCG